MLSRRELRRWAKESGSAFGVHGNSSSASIRAAMRRAAESETPEQPRASGAENAHAPTSGGACAEVQSSDAIQTAARERATAPADAGRHGAGNREEQSEIPEDRTGDDGCAG